jgi:DNA-binding NarL/FixJ family response regulator
MIGVFIVDDHGMVRRGLRSYLSIFDDLEVLGDAGDGEEALAALAATEGVDVVLMDLAMEPMDGVETTRRVRERWPDVEVVAVTSFIEETRVRAALEAGASGYVMKDAAPEDIAVAIRAAVAGELHLDPQVVRALDAALDARAGSEAALDALTAREREILTLVARGHANKEIGRQLGISERTARTHVSSVLRKLDVTSRTQAALLATRAGLR